VIFGILILGIFLGSVDFSSLSVSVGDAVFSCGNHGRDQFNAGRVCVGHAGAAGKSDQTGDAKTSGKTHAIDLGPSEKELLADILVVLQKK